jgi:hypothetical protein
MNGPNMTVEFEIEEGQTPQEVFNQRAHALEMRGWILTHFDPYRWEVTSDMRITRRTTAFHKGDPTPRLLTCAFSGKTSPFIAPECVVYLSWHITSDNQDKVCAFGFTAHVMRALLTWDPPQEIDHDEDREA